MKRRHVLITIGLGTCSSITGCISRSAELISGCPNPDIEEELPYENQLVEDAKHYGRAEDFVILLTDGGHVDDDIKRTLDQDGYEFVSETDFDEYSVAVLQVVTSIYSSDLEVLGVEREDPTTVRIYTCISDVGKTDDLHPHTQTVRIDNERRVPDEVVVTHFMGGDEQEIR